MQEYVYIDGKKYRRGYTTGSCASAASKASVHMLLTKEKIENINIDTPKGIPLTLKVKNIELQDNSATCSIEKDGGDDIDATHGMDIFAKAELVNKEEKDIQQYYKDWEIKKYSPTEVVLYREKDEYCDKHYVLRENNGVIAIYKIDDNNKETLRENTQIQTKYLPEIDLIKLKSGIYAIGEEELNSILEDFE